MFPVVPAILNGGIFRPNSRQMSVANFEGYQQNVISKQNASTVGFEVLDLSKKIAHEMNQADDEAGQKRINILKFWYFFFASKTFQIL